MSSEVSLGLRLTVPFWCSFRDPLSSNVHRTFPVPPPATLYGLVAAALGLVQDDYSRRSEMRFAVAIERSGELVETYSKWMKAAENPKDDRQKEAFDNMRALGLLAPDEAVWISTPIIRQKLIQPIFCVGILCAPNVAEELAAALERPALPLYLGESDDPVDIEVLGIERPLPSTGPATGTVGGVREGGVLAGLPTRFRRDSSGRWEVDKWLVSIPRPPQPIRAAGSACVSCHGHVWEFEPLPDSAARPVGNNHA